MGAILGCHCKSHALEQTQAGMRMLARTPPPAHRRRPQQRFCASRGSGCTSGGTPGSSSLSSGEGCGGSRGRSRGLGLRDLQLG